MIARAPYAGFTALDATLSASRMRFTARHGYEATEMMAAADDLRVRLLSLTGCAIVRQSIVYPFRVPTPAAPLAAHTSDRVGVLVFDTPTPGQYAVVDVPGIRDACILATGPNAGLAIDTDHPSIIAFVNAITSGDLWCSVFGYDVVSLVGTIVERRA